MLEPTLKVSSSQWHQRLGHPSPKVLNLILKSTKLDFSFNNVSSVCDAFQRANSHQMSYNKVVHVTSSPLEHINTNVWVPTKVSSGGFHY